jgi:hypothetical protein
VSGSFQLTLDTNAPRITWGAVVDPIASEDMTVFYAVDEPGVYDATLKLIDGRNVPMTVYSDRLVVRVPDDAQEQDATVHVTLRDNVWNSRTADLTVRVVGSGGVVQPPPYVPPTGLPSPPERTRHTVPPFQRRNARASSRYGQTTVAATPTITLGRVSSEYVLPSRTTVTMLHGLAVGTSTYRSTGGVSTRKQGKLQATFTVRKRPEGRGFEDELFLLDLL